jgi:hypothetical protein
MYPPLAYNLHHDAKKPYNPNATISKLSQPGADVVSSVLQYFLSQLVFCALA